MRRPLIAALLLSIALHIVAVLSPGGFLFDTPPVKAPRLEAHFTQIKAEVAPDKKPTTTKPAPPRRPKPPPLPPPRPDMPTARLPGDSEPVAETPPVAQSDAAAPTMAESSSAPSEYAAPIDSDGKLAGSPVAARLPREGKVRYTGTAGGFIALSASGEASWQHDGTRFKSRLSAGLSSPDSSLDFNAEGRVDSDQLVSETTRDNRRGKLSTGRIDYALGKVFMQRGGDEREREIKGLAVALSALPELLMTLDESVDKAAFFVVGDFWVADAVLQSRGKENLRLPAGSVDTLHYATRANNGTLIDVWLAPAWRNAPVRIRIQTGNIVVDLRAAEVEIEGLTLAHSPEARD